MAFDRPFARLASMLFPMRCGVCGAVGTSPCGPCGNGFVRARGAPAVLGMDRVEVCFEYGGTLRQLLTGLKYRNNRAAADWMAAELAAAWLRSGLDGSLTWAPTTRERTRRRGFDQSELLARATAARLRSAGRPVRVERLLHRVPGPAQTGRSAQQRGANVHFEVRRTMPGEAVVVLDDVLTTGSTLTAAALALRTAGAAPVQGLVLARRAWTTAPPEPWPRPRPLPRTPDHGPDGRPPP